MTKSAAVPDPADERLRAAWPNRPVAATRHLAVDQCVVDGGLAYVSGQVAFDGGSGPLLGKVGADVSVEQAAEEARRAAANALHRIAAFTGSLGAVDRILRVTVYVNAVDDFTEQPAVADGASRLLVDVLGDRGRHARAAVGVSSLPLGVPVEVELTARLRG